MKQKLFLFTIYCTTLCALTSCLKSSDNDGIIYHDAAITAFSVGTLKYNKLVNDKRGNDSIAHTTLNGATYRFYIDQLRHEIYNADSLPYGVDAKKVVCSLAAKNGGMVVYQPAVSRPTIPLISRSHARFVSIVPMAVRPTTTTPFA